MNMDYNPKLLINTESMPNDEWLKWRKKGIGGSDASIIMGTNPWRTIVDLYYDKVGIEPVIKEEDNEFAKDYGHTVEPLIAKWFEKTMYDMTVYKDSNMYSHPLYPFMLANLDYRIRLADGSEGILEIKSTTFRNSDEWRDGRLPVYYEQQVRHYMAVMNVDFVWVCCLWGNNFDGDSAKVKVERDLDVEESLIENEADFWQMVQNKEIPSYKGANADLAMNSLRRYIGYGDSSVPAVTLDESFQKSLYKISALNEQNEALKKNIKTNDKEIDTLSVPIISALEKAEKGIAEYPGVTFEINYKTRSTATFDRKKCQLKYPNVFAECSDKSFSRTLKVQKVEMVSKAVA